MRRGFLTLVVKESRWRLEGLQGLRRREESILLHCLERGGSGGDPWWMVGGVEGVKDRVLGRALRPFGGGLDRVAARSAEHGWFYLRTQNKKSLGTQYS